MSYMTFCLALQYSVLTYERLTSLRRSVGVRGIFYSIPINFRTMYYTVVNSCTNSWYAFLSLIPFWYHSGWVWLWEDGLVVKDHFLYVDFHWRDKLWTIKSLSIFIRILVGRQADCVAQEEDCRNSLVSYFICHRLSYFICYRKFVKKNNIICF